MAVVVQPAFRIEVLALEAQRVVDFADVEAGNLTIGAVVRRPDDFTVWVCKLLRCSEVVELVVEGLGVFRAKAFQQCQRPKTVRFVEVTAMAIRVMLGNQLVALPKKLCRYASNGFADPSPKRVIAIAGCFSVRLGDAYQPVLAVVAVFSNELMAFATSLTDQVAKGVIVVMMIALDHQAVAGNDVRAVAEAFLCVSWVIGPSQTGEGIVVVVPRPLLLGPLRSSTQAR
ncbi:hypothetical protein PSFL6913_29305 [Pseudomonas fluorescens]